MSMYFQCTSVRVCERVRAIDCLCVSEFVLGTSPVLHRDLVYDSGVCILYKCRVWRAV